VKIPEIPKAPKTLKTPWEREGSMQSITKEKEFLSRFQVAALFQVSPNTVTRWADAGKLPYCRTLGGHRRYERAAVENLIRTLKEEVSHVESITFFVPKMYGDHHVTAVRKLLTEMAGVEDVWASAAFQQVRITFDPDRISADRLGATLEEGGYPAVVRLPTQTPSQGVKDPAWQELSLRVTQSQGARS
jgi:excisionase family DNA binding protein